MLSSINVVDTLLSESVPFIIAFIVLPCTVGVSANCHTGGTLSITGKFDFVILVAMFLFPYISLAIFSDIIKSNCDSLLIAVPNVAPLSLSDTVNVYLTPFVIPVIVILALFVTSFPFTFIVIYCLKFTDVITVLAVSKSLSFIVNAKFTFFPLTVFSLFDALES